MFIDTLKNRAAYRNAVIRNLNDLKYVKVHAYLCKLTNTLTEILILTNSFEKTTNWTSLRFLLQKNRII